MESERCCPVFDVGRQLKRCRADMSFATNPHGRHFYDGIARYLTVQGASWPTTHSDDFPLFELLFSSRTLDVPLY